MGFRSVQVTVKGIPIVYKRGLFQGDALSLLLFCLAIPPLSCTQKEQNGLMLGCSTVKASVTYMLYMDDLTPNGESLWP